MTAVEPPGTATESRFSADLMYDAARFYYEEGLTQAEIASSLSVSRPTVSRLLAEARNVGIVEITVRRSSGATDALAASVASRLGLQRVYLAAGDKESLGRRLAPAVSQALLDARLVPEDVLLVSSGMTLYQCFQQELPRLPGVTVAPTVGGQEEPEPWYQTNVMTTLLAERVGGRPLYLYAPALPSASLRRSLLQDPSFRRVLDAWARARCALVGLGTALDGRKVIPAFVPRDAASLSRAVGDVCSRFYDAQGLPVDFPGSARLVAITLDALRALPVSIGVAAGPAKVPAIQAAATHRYINHLVTDVPTAQALALTA